MLFLGVLVAGCMEDEQDFPRTRLFKPVLQQDLTAEGNAIIVNFAKSKGTQSYTVQVSRDTFKTIDYTIETDTNYIVVNADLVGEELFWNTIYQLRGRAHADESQYDSRMADLGSIRTQRFPSNLNVPAANDVIDVAAKITWVRVGEPITRIGIFDPTDLRFQRPISFQPVSEAEDAEGLKIATRLQPERTYQIAIYSGETIRGWANYTTLASKVNKNDPLVIDLTGSIDPNAVEAAYSSATEGQIILLKKGVTYNLPSTFLANKSVTFMGDLGFEANKAKLYTTGNWNIADGADIEYIRFVDLEVEGEDFTGDYVFNPSGVSARLHELTFEDCIVHDFRGVIRIRDLMFIGNYNIRNSIVYKIGGYGLISCDTDGDGRAAVDNIRFENSTFSQVQRFIASRQNAQSIVMEGCTFNQVPLFNDYIFRFFGADGRNNVLNGISIRNSIFGHAWDQSGGENFTMRPLQGLPATNFDLVNVVGTSDLTPDAAYAIPGFPSATYGGGAADLWQDPATYNFNFKDTGFSGRTNTGDPRWRLQF